MSGETLPQYCIEYARSSRSKCKGLKPCKGTPINEGDLRFGTWVEFRANHTVVWRHWGCVTPKLLENLKKTISEPSQLEGYNNLRESDRTKIVKAWEDGRVAEDDIPESAKSTVNGFGEEKPKKKKDGGNKKAARKVGAGAEGSTTFMKSPAELEAEQTDHLNTVHALETALEPCRIEYGNQPQGSTEAEKDTHPSRIFSLLNTLSQRLDSLDKKLNRTCTSPGIQAPDPYLHPLPLPTPEKPANADKLFWTKKSWKWKDRPLKYVITVEGNSVPADKREEILMAAQGLLSDSAVRVGWHAQTWEKCGDMMKDIFVFGIERKFSEIALCANHWKAHRIAEDCYDVWRDGFFRSPIDAGSLVGDHGDAA